MTDLPADFESVQPPEGPATEVRTAAGNYQVFAEGGDETEDQVCEIRDEIEQRVIAQFDELSDAR